jgi:hypothetical protein
MSRSEQIKDGEKMRRRALWAAAAALITIPELAAAQGNPAEKPKTSATQDRAAQEHQHTSPRSEGIVGSSSASGTGSGTASGTTR